jgi:hypothetical protein
VGAEATFGGAPTTCSTKKKAKALNRYTTHLPL